ncbi:MAG TPA: ATP-binding cassette domain-containing protein, partial [Burkholderiales bacterium]|nr:ATP-binding cassette domain-containing protein [Burkholderiales bacterium]
MSLLEVRDLTVDFGAKRVVDRVSFTVEAGEKFALVGESGSGKTITALSLLRLAQDARVSGEVVFNGIDVLAMAETPLREMRGRDIAMIFQEPMTALNPIYSIGKQIVEA